MPLIILLPRRSQEMRNLAPVGGASVRAKSAESLIDGEKGATCPYSRLVQLHLYGEPVFRSGGIDL